MPMPRRGMSQSVDHGSQGMLNATGLDQPIRHHALDSPARALSSRHGHGQDPDRGRNHHDLRVPRGHDIHPYRSRCTRCWNRPARGRIARRHTAARPALRNLARQALRDTEDAVAANGVAAGVDADKAEDTLGAGPSTPGAPPGARRSAAVEERVAKRA